LKIARQSIEAHLSGKQLPPFELSDTLKALGAAFVTLTEYGQLRGCIGYTEAFRPLWQSLGGAVSAAVDDPFPAALRPKSPAAHRNLGSDAVAE
jgi:AMMECR1 domain-containing protein